MVITGMRRSGKSFLLFNLFYDYLKSVGVRESHLIKVDLDNYANRSMRNPDLLYAYVADNIIDSDTHYILLDEVQMVGHFEEVLKGFMKMGNVDIYVTGSNAKFLSKDILMPFESRFGDIFISLHQGLKSICDESMCLTACPAIPDKSV